MILKHDELNTSISNIIGRSVSNDIKKMIEDNKIDKEVFIDTLNKYSNIFDY